MDALLTQIASSVLIGLLSWGGSQFLTWYKANNARSRPAAPATSGPIAGSPSIPSPTGVAYAAQPAAPTVNYSKVLLHIGILQLVVNIVGLIIGIAAGALVGTTDTGLFYILLFFFGTLAAATMFFIFGLRVDSAVRWRHLSLVALGTIPLTLLVNALGYAVANIPLYSSAAALAGAVIVAFVQTFLSMGIGGGLAALVHPKRRLPAPGNAAYPYPPSAAYPYSYGPPGAAPSTPLGYPPSAAPYPAGYPGAPYPPNPAYPSGGYPPSPAGYPPYPAYSPPAGYPPSPAAYPPPPGYPATNPASPAGYAASPPSPGYPPASQPLTPYPPAPAPSAPLNPARDPSGTDAGTMPPDQPGYSPPSSTSRG